MTRRGLWLVNLALLAVTVSLVALPAVLMHGDADDKCDRLMALARDPRKIEYVRTWVAGRIKDERFMAQVRQYPVFDRSDPTSWHFIDLDWRYLGISPHLARLEFNGGDGRYVRTIGIRSVGLYQGRSGILVGLTSGELALGTWPNEAVRKLRPSGDNVFAYCDE